MFRNFFRWRKPQLSKSEMWSKYELFELFDDLEEAESILSTLSGGYSGEFSSAEDFYKEYSEEHQELKYSNVPDFKRLSLWFAPTSEWDDFVGMDGLELGDLIYERACRWNKANFDHR